MRSVLHRHQLDVDIRTGSMLLVLLRSWGFQGSFCMDFMSRGMRKPVGQRQELEA